MEILIALIISFSATWSTSPGNENLTDPNNREGQIQTTTPGPPRTDGLISENDILT